ncbi:hypothetical protein OKA06_17200 [Novosphingobium sp. MW5]|nr:hypothetical protein [Novosphingobium sp. MW5]
MAANAEIEADKTSGFTVTVVAVFVVAVVFSYVAWKFEVRSALNLAWMIAIPFILAMFFKKRLADRFALFALLGLASFLGIGVTAAFVGYP